MNIRQSGQNIKRVKVDLHTHTNHSDGTVSPKELVELAKKKGVKTIAITDHDTVSGVAEGIRHAKEKNIQIIPGIEISAAFDDGTFHILGYGIDVEAKRLLTAIERQQINRSNRNQKILSRLQELGIDITGDKELIKKSHGEGSLGRPHIAFALMNRGVVSSIDDAFARYLGRGGEAYIEKELLPHDEAIRIILEAKGTPVIAHPVTLKLANEDFSDYIKELKKDGLKGIEVYSSSHSRRQVDFFKEIGRREDLLISGGSDFHGFNKKGVRIGICNSGRAIYSDMISEELLSLKI